ncbi:MAG: J domain-containing protein [Leptolyngbya sp. SIO4C1]|nr:J domain-containing protein [Leptolyngbya sp. SIO4C1]
MQNFRNYYEILGIPQGATLEEIKQTYRKLARQYHPDLNPGDKAAEERFKTLSEAYEVLSDPDRRSQYEDYSRFWKQQGFRKQRHTDADFSEWDDFNNFVDQLLNRHQGKAAATKPRTQADDPFEPNKRKTTYTVKSRPARRDAEADLTVPLERAYSGGHERIRLEDGRSLEVNMPAGMVTGQRIRLRGQGLGGGDLYLKIFVEPHPLFQLQDDDIVCRIPLSPSEAILGSQIEVPTLDGPVKMVIPPGVQPGQKLRLAGKGYPMLEGDRGDQIVEIAIAIPTVLDPEEKALYQELYAIESFDPRANLPL